MFSPHLLDRANVPDPDHRPACAGESELFDSTTPADHKEARALCADCPVIAACRTNLRDEMRREPGGRPTGTWAGKLFVSAGGMKSHRARRAS